MAPGLALPVYNASPGRQLPVVLDAEPERIVPAFWGMESAAGRLLVNARSETAHLRPAFRDSFHRRRCLVPADGFYEWHATPGGKQPYRFTLADDGIFAFAGLWTGEDRPAFVILTTRPNGLTAPVHDRMPVILDRERWSDWLVRDPAADAFLVPYAEARMRRYPVSRAVNSSGNEGPELVEPVELTGPLRKEQNR